MGCLFSRLNPHCKILASLIPHRISFAGIRADCGNLYSFNLTKEEDVMELVLQSPNKELVALNELSPAKMELSSRSLGSHKLCC